MAMPSDLRELGSELDACRRLVTELETELGASGLAEHQHDPRVRALLGRILSRPTLLALPTLLVHARAELRDVLDGLQVSREELRSRVVDRLRASHGIVGEVNATAESATMALLNALDGALQSVSGMKGLEGDAVEAARAKLEEEISAMYAHLQFQDITSQQLQGVAANLANVQEQIDAVARLFEQRAAAHDAPRADAAGEPSQHLAFNPQASFQVSAETRRVVEETLRGA